MNRLRLVIVTFGVTFCAALLFASPSLRADDAKSGTESGGHVLKPFSDEFERLASLVGIWKGKKKDEATGKMVDMVVEYRLSSGNSALIETLMKDSPDEMISVYHDDRDGIMMTHYCGLGNQPRMKAMKFVDDQIEFKFIDGSNMKSPQEMHMGGLRLTIVDKDHIRHHWQLFMDGKPVDDHSPVFELQRVR